MKAIRVYRVQNRAASVFHQGVVRPDGTAVAFCAEGTKRDDGKWKLTEGHATIRCRACLRKLEAAHG